MATELGAYTGKILKIDLTAKAVEEYPFSDDDRKKYLGGKIMAAKIIADHIKAPIDPLGEENIIAVTTGPLNGMGSPCSSRFNISAISPLTNLYTSSNCGGNFGLNLKRAGIDALIITGKSEEKVYLEVTPEGVEFKNADSLWGMNTGPAQKAISPKGGKIVIGPAGENLVKYACVVSEERCAGRGGVGAVFGSKNLKGVFAQGNIIPKPKNKEKIQEINKEWTLRLKAHPTTGEQLPKYGTAGLVTPMHVNRLLSTKNYNDGRYEHFEDISGETLTEKYLVKNKGCITCPIQCARVVTVDDKQVKGPEVETLGLLGANILNNDMQKILDWNHYLDEVGMDAISFANTLSFAMELNEKGMWDNNLSFGKIDNITELIEKTARRDGEVPSLIAEGSKRIAEKFGGKEFAMNVKGMELAAYEPRGAVGQGLGYAVANRGGCHLNGGYLVVLEGLGIHVNGLTPHSKAELAITFQNLMEAVSAGGNCLFTTYAFFPMPVIKKPNSLLTRIVNAVMPLAGPIVRVVLRFPLMAAINLPANMLPHPKALTAAVGVKYDFGKFIRIGERGYTLERMIDVKLGVSAKDDVLPARLTDEEQIPGNPKTKVPLEKMRKNYYKARGWDKNGIPKPALLKRLGLEFMLN